MEGDDEMNILEIVEESLLYVDQPQIITTPSDFVSTQDSLDEEGLV